jgi:hypothetical protein
MHVCVRPPCSVGLGSLVPLAVLAPPTGGVVDPSGTRLTLGRAFFFFGSATLRGATPRHSPRSYPLLCSSKLKGATPCMYRQPRPRHPSSSPSHSLAVFTRAGRPLTPPFKSPQNPSRSEGKFWGFRRRSPPQGNLFRSPRFHQKISLLSYQIWDSLVHPKIQKCRYPKNC